jgi:hypothetical protein
MFGAADSRQRRDQSHADHEGIGDVMGIDFKVRSDA